MFSRPRSELGVALGDGACGATFSVDMASRFALHRIWAEHRPYLNVIALNPSTADHEKLDPTVRRCKALAERLGFGGLVMTNIFAYRSTNPRALLEHANPLDDTNAWFVTGHARRAGMAIAAWGTWGRLRDQGRRVARMLGDLPLYHLGLTKDGHPKHPLYLSNAIVPELWTNRYGEAA